MISLMLSGVLTVIGKKVKSLNKYCKKGNWTSIECSNSLAVVSLNSLNLSDNSLSTSTFPNGVSQYPYGYTEMFGPIPLWFGPIITNFLFLVFSINLYEYAEPNPENE